MVFSQNVNWFILYQLADKMAIILLNWPTQQSFGDFGE